MRSLFAQLWVAFLAVTALTFAASFALSYAAAVRRSSEAGLVSPGALAASAQQALSSGGGDGLDAWSVAEVHRQPEIAVYFVDQQGRDALGRDVHGQPVAASVGRSPPTILAPDGTVYRVVVRRVRGVVFDFWRMLLRPWVLGALVLAISGLGCAWLAWWMSRPVRQLRSAVREVAAGRLDVEVSGSLQCRHDELGGLARDFSQMTRDLRALIASKEELLRDVSHELRSPLARLRLAAALARKGAGERRQAFARIDREVERIDSMIGQILDFSRLSTSERSHREQVDVTSLVQQAVDDVRIEAEAKSVSVIFAATEDAIVDGDPFKLVSAFDNVLRNAIHHAPTGSAIEVRASAESQTVRIVVSDRGPGIADIEEGRMFEPFSRGSSSKGAGLGLAITRNIMEQHGGSAIAAKRSGGGLEVSLTLPQHVGGTLAL